MNLPQAKYDYDAQYRFTIDQYNWAKPFSNFFPGIAGKWGIPMWIYYVNRGQAVCSIGIHNKDHSIMEFLSFNKAYQVVGQQGFRTFLRVDDNQLIEPFKKNTEKEIHQKMTISAHELEIEERNEKLGFLIKIVYFPLPNLPIPGLVRQFTLKNLTEEARKIELVDGLAKILPFGVQFEHMKVIPRHIEGMMGVEKTENASFYSLKQTPEDIERIGEITGGNYYLSFNQQQGNLARDHILDPFVLFGDSESYDHPWRLDLLGFDAVCASSQTLENRTPCAMTATRFRLEPADTYSLISIIGYTPEQAELSRIIPSLKEDMLASKRLENEQIIQEIKQTALTVSDVPLFDQYCQQTFLENVMRGGMPVRFESQTRQKSLYVYNRQNGDLERDYHWFILEPTYLSQGNSHFRNILQNRRMDASFFPFISDDNLFRLGNLFQLDGYNPLEVKGITFQLKDKPAAHQILTNTKAHPFQIQSLLSLMGSPFTAGQLAAEIEKQLMYGAAQIEPILTDLLSACKENEIGGIYEGFWIDHWHYLLDLLEAMEMIYPDRIGDFLFSRKDYTYYDNPDVIVPREQKTVLTSNGYRQYGAVFRDPQKAVLIKSRKEDGTKVRARHGEGEIYTTNLLEKLLCIIATRIAALDPRGYGVEMEASKPGWCDSLNGLPGLFGSSIPETLEILRACRMLSQYLSQTALHNDLEQPIFVELYKFWDGLESALDLFNEEPGSYWAQSHDLLEDYRKSTRFGIQGQIQYMPISRIISLLEKCIAKLERKFREAKQADLFDPSGVPLTYFINQIEENSTPSRPAEPDTGAGKEIKPGPFSHLPLSLFLEGPVHTMRVFPENAQAIHRAVRRSALYDPNLQMYKCCESLDQDPLEIGRIKSYAEGWLENGSIYTHMEYKWLLEILKSGLYEEFFKELPKLLVPFFEPAVYGRSTLENCSFIVSSAFPDQNLHGQSFQPRLSGMTCEFLNMWTIMTCGKQPFFLDEEKQLRLKLYPILPDWLFTKQDKTIKYLDFSGQENEMFLRESSFACKFLGRTIIIYHNPKRKCTYGSTGVKPAKYSVQFQNGDLFEIESSVLPAGISEKIRLQQAERIIVNLD